ncbi:dihydroneopterin aldolase [Salinimonas chungwhensis]|uniref:dihydroneopterin aldolase n=1 Tax=Salinimonas chungwhensis TaxID=265425 RepID=UPI00037387A1|nr:dihydroneopterin aldolase [Salinimonas chungwhensis]
MDQIHIQELGVDALIGVYDWERKQKTHLLIDLTIQADLLRARHSDDVADTIDYAVLAEFIQSEATSTQFELLEALGHFLCNAVLRAFPIAAISLAITKPNILPDAKAVTVTISAARDQ